jgi:hypothetical protein
MSLEIKMDAPSVIRWQTSAHQRKRLSDDLEILGEMRDAAETAAFMERAPVPRLMGPDGSEGQNRSDLLRLRMRESLAR